MDTCAAVKRLESVCALRCLTGLATFDRIGDAVRLRGLNAS
jgi:hypothetical protein